MEIGVNLSINDTITLNGLTIPVITPPEPPVEPPEPPVEPPATGTPFPDVASHADVLDWISATQGGLTGALPVWPFTPDTVGNGMALLVPVARRRVDYGRPDGLPEPAPGTSHPKWGSPNRIYLNAGASESDRVIENYTLPDGIVFVAPDCTGDVIVRDSLLGSEQRYLDPYVVRTDQSGAATLDMRRCDVAGASSCNVMFNRGRVIACHIRDSMSDQIYPRGDGEKLVAHNLLRRVGQNNPTTHGDGLQMIGDVSNLLTFGNMIYMPYPGSEWNEGSYGTHAALFFGASPQGDTSDLISVADCCIGGGTTAAFAPKPGRLSNGLALVGTWFSKPLPLGGQFTQYHSVSPGAGGNQGTSKNILMHNCRYLEDGSPVLRMNAQYQWEDHSGLWDYDRESAPPLFRQVAERLGYINALGEPQVPVRTGFHPGGAA